MSITVLPQATTFLLTADVNALTLAINARLTMGGLTYAFFGECHDSEVDKTRRSQAAGQFAADNRVSIVAERGMTDLDLGMRSALNGRAKTIVEISPASSRDDVRNSNIADQIVTEFGSNPGTVLIFFGQDHEDRLIHHLGQMLPASAMADWLSFPSITEAIEALPDPGWNSHGYVSAGFTTVPTRKRADHHKLLLKKNRWVESFAMEVGPRRTVGDWCEVWLRAGEEALSDNAEEIKRGKAWYLDVWEDGVARLKCV